MCSKYKKLVFLNIFNFFKIHNKQKYMFVTFEKLDHSNQVGIFNLFTYSYCIKG